MNLQDRAKQLLRMCGHALTRTVHDRLDMLEKLLETDEALLQASIHIVENHHALAGRTIVETDTAHSSPEAALTAFLYSHVPARAAIEVAIGGDRERTAALRRAGYEVYAFESGRSAGKSVISRMNGKLSGVSDVSDIAIETPIASVAGVTGAIPLDIPEELGLMTLGSDALPVVREFGDRHACVIAADLQADFEELVGELRSREYYWHIVLYRTSDRDQDYDAGRNAMSFYANHPRALPNSRGSVFFFRDYRVFRRGPGLVRRDPSAHLFQAPASLKYSTIAWMPVSRRPWQEARMKGG